MKKISLLLVISAIHLSSAAQPVLIGSSSFGDTYADPQDLRIVDNGFAVKTISNLKGNQGHSAGRAVGSLELNYEVRCFERQQKLTRAISFAGQMGQGNILDTAQPPGNWEAIEKGSVIDVLHNAICKN
jgi:hypothetical protein